MRSIKIEEIEDHKLKYLEAKRMKELELFKERKRQLDDIEEKTKEDHQKLQNYHFNGRKSPKAMIQYEKEQ